MVTKGRLRSNNNGDIKILDDADVTAAWIDLSLPRNFSSQEVYQRDMHVVLDGGKLTLQGAERTFGDMTWTVNGIFFCPNEGEERDPRGHVEIKSGTIVIEKPVDEGKVLTDCPDENITISDTMKIVKDSSALTVEELQKGAVNASSRNDSKPSVTEIFDDVKAGSWYVNAIQYVYDNGIMSGKGKSFKPDSPLTREEFVQVLYNNAGKPEVTIENHFSDVKDNGWYKASVLWANEKGIASGKPDGSFGIGKQITRQDLAKMLYEYAKTTGLDSTKDDTAIEGYKDTKKVSNYAKEAMAWAVSQGIISGKGEKGAPKSETRLDPQGKATRAECASMMKKLLEKNAK